MAQYPKIPAQFWAMYSKDEKAMLAKAIYRDYMLMFDEIWDETSEPEASNEDTSKKSPALVGLSDEMMAKYGWVTTHSEEEE